MHGSRHKRGGVRELQTRGQGTIKGHGQINMEESKDLYLQDNDWRFLQFQNIDISGTKHCNKGPRYIAYPEALSESEFCVGVKCHMVYMNKFGMNRI